MRNLLKAGFVSAALLTVSANAMADGTHYMGVDIAPAVTYDKYSKLDERHIGIHYGYEWKNDYAVKPYFQLGWLQATQKKPESSSLDFSLKIGGASYLHPVRLAAFAEVGNVDVKVESTHRAEFGRDGKSYMYTAVGGELGFVFSKKWMMAVTSAHSTEHSKTGLTIRYAF